MVHRRGANKHCKSRQLHNVYTSKNDSSALRSEGNTKERPFVIVHSLEVAPTNEQYLDPLLETVSSQNNANGLHLVRPSCVLIVLISQK